MCSLSRKREFTEMDIERLTSDTPPQETESLLGVIPARWGRMSRLSRLVLVETGRILRQLKLLNAGERLCDRGMTVGSIGATRRGSLHTDIAFKETMTAGPGLASPALFGYTLPNTPLAEAAVLFGLNGPVYALFEKGDDILERAEQEAADLLEQEPEIDFMLACAFDHYPIPDGKEKIYVTLTVIKRDGDRNPCIS